MRFAADLKSVARPKFYRGVVVVHLHTSTIYLVDERGCTVDKRSGGGFVLSPGATVAFPCHVAHIEENITGGGMHRETATKKLWLVGEQLRWRKDSDRDQVRRFHTPPSSPCLPRLPPWSFELVTEMVEISEEKMRRFAGRDARMRIRLREIGAWYLSKREMYAEAEAIVENLTETEERSLFGRGGRKHPLQVLLWAADQADSLVRAVARKWVAFTIFATANLAPAMRGSALRPREGVLALPALGSAMDPIVDRLCSCVYRLDPFDLRFSSLTAVGSMVLWSFGVLARQFLGYPVLL